ncbi:putative DNA-binding transcriptional regulator YafY [Streptomyces sp. 1114.5]|uniref:helix-turn-helix transcriptional regulator n=1 Tax=Streptomyces sp. 1114.5 TaxID=1938830 RepID=UPI000EABC17B|nr:WYL domain-containing protein [Streptomyces sp. 1114.5]RKT18116.1 putative DNA-binding transcriptional regulator YafY [Streptomyces sp. 1114.5]
MKADRLLSILLLLQTRGRVSATELAERLEVSVRTIYRDVDSLSAAGVPVFTERGRHGGIGLLPGYRTDVTGLTADEAKALFVLSARGAHSDLGLDGALGSALRKVMAALPAPHRPAAERTSERILVDPARWMQGAAPGGAPGPDLGELQYAVFADRRLRLRYRHGGAPGPVEYTVDPYGLVNKAGVWYLVADLHGEPRLFRADRVLAAETAEEAVRRRAGVGLGDAWAVLREQVERLPVEVPVRVRVRRGRLDMFLRIHGGRVTAPPPEAVLGPAEDWVEVAMAFPAPAAVRSLLALGADVEVLAPPAARRELARAAAEALRLYQDQGP